MMTINGGDKSKFTLCLDDLDLGLLQIYKARKKDDVIPIWSKSNLNLRNGPEYYEFEVVTGRLEDAVSEANGSDIPSSNKTQNLKADSHTKSSVNEERIDLPTYLKMITAFQESPSNTLTAVCEDYVEITAMSGDIMQVTVDNFHGYHNADGQIRCRVCRIIVEDMERHNLTVKHMKRITNHIRDMHCIRKVDVIWNHCILCNEVIEKTEAHITSPHHRSLLEGSLVTGSVSLDGRGKTRHQQSTSPIVSNTKYGNTAILSNTTTTSNTTTFSNNVTASNTVTKFDENINATTGDKQNQDLIEKEKGNSKLYLCDICKVTVPNKAPYIMEHENGAPHKKKLNKIKLETKTMDGPSVVPSNKSENSISNKQNLDELSSLNYNVTPNFHICDICKVKISNNASNIEEHENGASHRSNLNKIKLQTTSKNPSHALDSKSNVLLNSLAQASNENVTSIYSTAALSNKNVTLSNKNMNSKNPTAALGNKNLTTMNPTVALSNKNVALMDPPATTSTKNVTSMNPTAALSNKNVALMNPPATASTKNVTTMNPTATLSNNSVTLSNKNVTLSIGSAVSINPPATTSTKNVTLINSTAALGNKNVTSINSTLALSNKNVTLSIGKNVAPMNPTATVGIKNVVSMNSTAALGNKNVTTMNSTTTLSNKTVILTNKHFCWSKLQLASKPAIVSNTTTATIIPSTTSNNKITTHICSVCKVEVPNNASNIKSHEEGRQHKKNLNNASNNETKAASANLLTNKNVSLLNQPSNKNEISPATTTKTNNNRSINSDDKITSATTSRDRVSDIHYSMEKTTYPNLLNCTTCQVKVPNNILNIDEHIQGANHKNILMTTNKIVILNGKYYCNICKIYLVFTVNDHINTEIHKNNLAANSQSSNAESLSTKNDGAPKENDIKVESSTVYCEICKKNVTKFATDVIYSEGLASHKSCIIKNAMSLATDGTINGVIPIKLTNTETNEHRKCNYCKAEIASNDPDVAEHKNGTCYNSLLRSNKVKRLNDQYLQCNICNVYILKGNEIDHIDRSEHMIKKNKLVKKTCNETYNVYSTNESQYTRPARPDTTIVNGGFCDICEINVVGMSMAVHKIGPQHQEKSNYLKLFYDFHELTCIICKVYVINTVEAFYKHTKTDIHIKKHKRLMDYNKMIHLSGSYYCQCCCKQIGKMQEIRHIVTDSHNDELNKEIHFFCKACNVTVFGQTMTEHGVLNHSYDIIEISQFHNERNSTCKVCKIYVDDLDELIDHCMSSDHKNNYRLLIKRNKISHESKSAHFCDCCQLPMMKGTLMDHISSDYHISKLGNQYGRTFKIMTVSAILFYMLYFSLVKTS